MAEPLDPNTQERIDALCRRIAVAHNLDTEIQSELRGHMEDKLLAYLSGEERVTPEDAFILVREHFGDPSRLKSLLQDVHVVDTHVSLTRRLLAIVPLTFAQWAVMSTLITVSWSADSWLYYSEWNLWPSHFYPISLVLIISVAMLAWWRVLQFWQRSIERGESPWFQRFTSIQFAVLLLCLFGLWLLVPRRGEITADAFTNTAPYSQLTNAIAGMFLLVCLVYQAIMWLWWCDRPPRRTRTLMVSALLWLGFAMVPWHSIGLFEVVAYSVDPAAIASDSVGEFVLYRASGGEYPSIWAIRPRTLSSALDTTISSPVALVFIVAIATFLYRRIEPTRRPRLLTR